MTLANAKGELRPLPLKCAAEAIFNHSNCSDFWAQYSEAKHAHVCAKDTEQPLLNNVKKKSADYVLSLITTYCINQKALIYTLCTTPVRIKELKVSE